MTRRMVFAMLALMLILLLVSCGGKTTAPTEIPDDLQHQMPIDPATPDNSVQPEGHAVIVPGDDLEGDPYTLPVLPEKNRNIPAGSNVVKVGDKWIVAANFDADYYRDSCYRQLDFYVLSREPMDPDTITLRFDRDLPNTGVGVTDGKNAEYEFPYWLYCGYMQADWKLFYQWEYKTGSLTQEEADKMSKWETDGTWFKKNGVSGEYCYRIGAWLGDIEEEMTIHSVTVSWPGVSKTADIGEIRCHPTELCDGYIWESEIGVELLGLHGDAGIFGPGLVCTGCDVTAESELTIRSVSCLNADYEVVGVAVAGTSPGVKDLLHVKADKPVIVSPGAEAELRVYVTGPHLTELAGCGQELDFVIDCEVDGRGYQLLWQGSSFCGCDPYVMFAAVMDNVDVQGYYESFAFDPQNVGYPWDAEVFRQIGWTEKWEAMMAAE